MMGLIYMPFNIRWVRKMTSLICLHQIFFFLVQLYKIINLKIDGALDLKIYGNVPALPSLWSSTH